jgi:hypothetical protein
MVIVYISINTRDKVTNAKGHGYYSNEHMLTNRIQAFTRLQLSVKT